MSWVLEAKDEQGHLVFRQEKMSLKQLRQAFYLATNGEIPSRHLPRALEYRVKWEES